ncbi:MAG TPA: rhodanese-like domain-containing protein [Chloroflexia bacterium]|nr:rhodanese-like domain-containing protein [Chloroflexia bacterium]
MLRSSGNRFELPYKDINALKAAEKFGDKSVLFLDVREPYEYAQVHIPGSKLLPLSHFTGAGLKELGDLDREIVVVCHSGNRSAVASQYLAQLGYKKVSNLSGGITSWLMQGLPSER